MISEPWDVVIVPFPFTDKMASKRRPALVLSRRSFNQYGHTVLSMITSKAHTPWPGDSHLKNHQAAGLRQPCMVRLKIFTLDKRLIIRRIGRLSEADRAATSASLRSHLVR